MQDYTKTNGFPTSKELARQLHDKMPLWNEVCRTGTETGAIWKWMYAEKSGQWSYRAYLPGDRFFATLSLCSAGFEVSLNLKTEEWDYLYVDNAVIETKIAALKAKAEQSGDNPAWIHVPVVEQSDILLVARLFAARARRIQPLKAKSGRRR